MYRLLIRPFIKNLPPEKAARISMRYFRLVGMIPGGRFINRLIHGNRATGLQKEVFGLNFYNPIGLGAGLDRNAYLYNDLNDLGFSFSEIGPLDRNGVIKAVKNIQKDPQNDILAACIDKDYLEAFTLAYDFCDFFVIDILGYHWDEVLSPILDARLSDETYKPIIVKINDNHSNADIQRIVEYCMLNGIDGIQIQKPEHIELINSISKGRLPIMANCQVNSPEEAAALLDSGASLLEIGMDLVYQGPNVVRKTLRFLDNRLRRNTNQQ